MTDNEACAGRPENLYELCEQVCEAIEMRPLNYHQDYFKTEVSHILEDANLPPGTTEEPCGTAFCRAGWMMSILTGSRARTMQNQAIYEKARYLLERAGVSYTDVSNLFSGWAIPKEAGAWGTPGYVAAGVKGMQDFMTKYETQLKATKLTEGDFLP